MNKMNASQQQRGLSLVEFMVAMLLGTVLIGGAITIYLASQRSYQETERAVIMGDGGRFAMMLIGDALRHTGFMGGMRGTDVDQDTNLGAITNNCTGEGDAYNLGDFLFATTVDSSGAALGCIDDGRPNTEVLVVKHFLPAPFYDEDPNDPTATLDGDFDYPGENLDPETTYVIANVERGLLVDGAEPEASLPNVLDGYPYARALAWPYQFQIFYIREVPSVGSETIPTLARKFLTWDSTAATMTVETQNLVEGVENMRFRFGFDTNADGVTDSFGGVSDVTNWDNVAYVEPYILARSSEDDPTYVDEKTYRMAGTAVTPDPNEANFLRYLVTGGVTLRNPNLYLLGEI